MSNILYAWELGGGIGHLGPFFPIAKQLAAAGHRLYFAVRDLSRIVELFAGVEFTLFQSPTQPQRGPAHFPEPVSLPQILHNVGFAEPSHLAGRVKAWKAVLDAVQPDLIIADHAPGVLLAARGRDVCAALIGTGFVCPPNDYPMPALCTWQTIDDQKCRHSEDALIEQINVVLAAERQPKLASLGELYAQADKTFLATFAELDHYGGRPAATYFGAWPYDESAQAPIPWPDGDGPRIFAYLKPSRGLGALFDWLATQRHPTLVVGDGLNIEGLRSLAKPNLRFQREPLPLPEVARQCDAAILNATHGTTCSLLLSGKPIFQLPHNLEQAVTAVRTMEIGAAAQANKDDGSKIVWELSGFLHHDRYASAARGFAERYESFRPSDSVTRIAAELNHLL